MLNRAYSATFSSAWKKSMKCRLMNWVGGIRNRLRGQDEKKRQREFFERQKYVKRVRRVDLQLSQLEDKPAVSQDLLSLQITNRIHRVDKSKDGSGSKIKVSAVNLDQSEPFNKKIQMIDLSPSLMHTPSRIDINAAESSQKYDHTFSSNDRNEQNAHPTHNLSLQHLQPVERCRPGFDGLDKKLETQMASTTCVKIPHQDSLEECSHTEKANNEEKKMRKTKRAFLRGEFLEKKTSFEDPTYPSSKITKIKNEKYKIPVKNVMKQPVDSSYYGNHSQVHVPTLISEDFLSTPLKKYRFQTQRSALEL